MPAPRPAKTEFMALHIRVPKSLYDKLIARLAALRETNPMANLSDAVRDVIEKGVREKR